MPTAPGSRSTWTTALALFLGLAFALGAAGFDSFFRTPFLETGDAAVNALQIDNAGRFEELYGNYSRWEFSHPGPAFFYVYAAGEALFHRLLAVCPSPGNAHLFTCMLLQVFFFSLGLAILTANLRWRAFLPLALLAGLWQFGAISAAVAPSPGPFMSIWPPWVLLMPALCFLSAAVSVARGRSDHLAIATLAGGFLVHGHVAQPLFVGTIGVLALAIWRRSDRMLSWRAFGRTHQRTLLGSAGLVLLFALPLAIDVATLGTRSNVATILGRFYSNIHDESGSKTAFESAEYFLTFATSSAEQEFLFPQPDPAKPEAPRPAPKAPAFLAAHALRISLWLAILGLPPLLAWFGRRRLEVEEKRFFAVAYGLLAAAIGVCLLWGLAQAGLMYHFNGIFYYAVYYFGALLALGLVARFLEPIALPVAMTGLSVLAAVGFGYCFRLPGMGPGNRGESVLAGVETALRADTTGKPKLLMFEHRDWPTVVAIALDLQRRGVPYFLGPYWEYMFGQSHDQLLLGANPEDKTSGWWITAPQSGEQPIVTPGGVPLAIHLEPAELRPEGSELTFTSGQNGYRYLVSGLTVGNVDHGATVLPRLTFLLRPGTAERDVSMILDVAATVFREDHPASQAGEVRFNDELVGVVQVGARRRIEVVVPRELWNRSSRAKLEISFPGSTPVRPWKRPRYAIWPGWNLWSVSFRYADRK